MGLVATLGNARGRVPRGPGHSVVTAGLSETAVDEAGSLSAVRCVVPLAGDTSWRKVGGVGGRLVGSHNPFACGCSRCLCPCLQKRASILNKTDVSSGFLTVWRPAAGDPGQLRQVQLPVGSVRVSLGYLSTFEDVYAFVHFLKHNYLDRTPGAAAAATTPVRVAQDR